MMKEIKNIIYDLGGVVITLNRDEAVRRLQALGITEADKMLDQYEQRGPFIKLETGKVSAAELYKELRAMAHEGVNEVDIQDAFEGFLVDLPVERLQMLREARDAGLKIFMLSNTNPVMYDHWIAEHFRQEGLTVNDYFDGIVKSYEEGTCKPDPTIFNNLLRRYNLDPEETAMLDDSPANCKTAASLGLRTRRIDNAGPDNMLSVTRHIIKERAL